jgi:4-amino-4-deoxy-L-arabinose transferase-like glycosyltransferase
MVFPLVVLLAVLPGLLALKAWDLTPPGPMWGIRGLTVLDGLVLDQTPGAETINQVSEAAAFRAVAYQPPLYAWLEALGFRLSTDCNPLVAVLPSYLAGALTVVLIYLHGRLWCGASLGLTAAILLGFNQNLLLRMQEATPTTLVLCGVIAALLCYGQHERVTSESADSWRLSSTIKWAIIGGVALGLALLAFGGLALIVVPIVLLHRYYLCTTSVPLSKWFRVRSSWLGLHSSPGLVGGLLALTVALFVTLPWFSFMISAHGWEAVAALATPPGGLPVNQQLSLLPRLIALAPVSAPLGLFGAARAIEAAMIDESNACDAVRNSFWVIWLVVAALLPTIWHSGPQSAFNLILVVPICLLAAQTITDLINRKLSVRTLIGLGPATAMSVAWSVSADLRESVGDVIRGHADTATALGLHLAVDLIVASVWLAGALTRWAHRRDDRQRLILSTFLLVILAILVVGGLREVLFRHSETRDLLSLRTMVLRRNREVPFRTLAVVGSSSLTAGGRTANGVADQLPPGGRLRFILRTALPHLPQLDLRSIDELFHLVDGQRLIVLVGAEGSLSSADQFKLGVEAIHPGRFGVLGAYATTRPQSPQR